MKTVYPILLTAFFVAVTGPYMPYYERDENHDPMEMQKEEERKDLKKPGEISDEDQLEEARDVKDADPEYEPIDDDLDSTEGDVE